MCTHVRILAHQGNGHERDKLHFKDKELVILDVYNPRIYPGDTDALDAIDIPGRVPSGSDTDRYLRYELLRKFSRALHAYCSTLNECLQTAAVRFSQ